MLMIGRDVLESVIDDLANRGYQVIGPTLRTGAPIARGRLPRALSHFWSTISASILPLRRRDRSPPEQYW